MTGYNTTRNRMIAGRAIISALVLAALAFSGVAAGEQFYVNESGWWREDGVFNANGTPIQAASDVIRLTTTSSMDSDIAVYKKNVHIVWSDKRDNNWEIYYRKSIDNGVTWEKDKRLTYDLGTSYPGSSYPRISVNGGNIYIVWQDDKDGNFEIYYKFSNDNGSSWSNDIKLTYTAGHSIQPDIAVSGDNIHIVWMGDYSNIFYINSIDGGKTWSSEVELASTSFSSWCPSIEANGDNVHVAWRDRYSIWVPELGEKGKILYMRSTDNGHSWATPIVLTETYTYGWETVWKPGLAVNGNNVHIVWENNSEIINFDIPKSDIYYLRSSDNGTTWNDKIRLTYSNDLNHPTVSAYGDFVHIAWREREPNALNYIISKDDGSTWSHVISLSTSLKVFVYLAMAVTEDSAYIVWYDSAPDVGNFTDWREYSIFYNSIKVCPEESHTFTTTDAAIALQIAVGSRPPDSRWDVSRDGSVTSLDALMILQAAAHAIEL